MSDAGFKAVFGDQKNKDVRRAMRLRKRQF